jgi:protein associated with RNAse G/E
VKPLSVLVSFNGRGETLEYQCDVAFPATIIGRRIDFIDLDVDLMVAPDGTARERDHDTFARNRETMGYSPEAVRMAAEGMALAHELHERGLAPFDGSPQGVLGRVVASMGPL